MATKKYSKAAQDKIEKVMREKKRGTLRSGGSGKKVTSRKQATLATAYSVRPKPGATVSMPLHWEEVKKGMRIQDFHIGNAVGKIKEQGDIFKPVIGRGINMEKAIKELEKLR